MNKDDIIQLFLEEVVERISDLSVQLFDLEKDPSNIEIVNFLFRVAHTIKGNASTAYNTLLDMAPDAIENPHIDKLAKITHAMENLIMEVRDNGLSLNEERIDALFETEDALSTLVSYIQSGEEDELEIEDLRNKLIELAEHDEVPTQKEVEVLTGSTYKLSLDCDNDYKHAFSSIIYKDIEEVFGEGNITFQPEFDELMNGVNFDDVILFFHHVENHSEAIKTIKAMDYVDNVTIYEGDSSVDEKINEEVISDDSTLNTDSETKNEISKKDEINKVIEDKKQSPKQTSKRSTSTKSFTNTNVRVAISRVDEVLKHVSSLVILKNKLHTYSKSLTDEGAKLLQDISEDISQSVDRLQESVMTIRMTPLEQTFQRFPTDVRKTAKEFGKKVNFSYSGAETEIDKSLLDELYDPIMHLVRNSIFHGIEGTEERINTGKDEIGSLTIDAKHEENFVVITIKDDGKGIDVEKVANKALEKGVITDDELNKMDINEKMNLIFAQGLSTAESVNSVAGRGVGMDAVRAKIEGMKGTVQIFSEPGKGTSTVIRLPLTLAIVKAMLTKIGEDIFAFPLSMIDEVVKFKTDDIKFVANKEVYVLRDKEVPIVRLNQFFNIPSESDNADELNLVILKVGDRLVGATVDEHVGQEDIVVKSIGKYLGNVPGISGCNILGDGSISLIVDVNTLINRT